MPVCFPQRHNSHSWIQGGYQRNNMGVIHTPSTSYTLCTHSNKERCKKKKEKEKEKEKEKKEKEK